MLCPFTKECIEAWWSYIVFLPVTHLLSGGAGLQPQAWLILFNNAQGNFCICPLVFLNSDRETKHMVDEPRTCPFCLPPSPHPQPLKGETEAGSCIVSTVPLGTVAKNASRLDIQYFKCSEFHFLSHKGHSLPLRPQYSWCLVRSPRKSLRILLCRENGHATPWRH